MATLYETLGVAPRAALPAIKAAHRELVRLYHPDRAGGDAARCAEANVAWSVLKDPARRRRYDLLLSAKAPAPCGRCAGTGSVTVQAGFKAKRVKVCPACLGGGTAL